MFAFRGDDCDHENDRGRGVHDRADDHDGDARAYCTKIGTSALLSQLFTSHHQWDRRKQDKNATDKIRPGHIGRMREKRNREDSDEDRAEENIDELEYASRAAHHIIGNVVEEPGHTQHSCSRIGHSYQYRKKKKDQHTFRESHDETSRTGKYHQQDHRIHG